MQPKIGRPAIQAMPGDTVTFRSSCTMAPVRSRRFYRSEVRGVEHGGDLPAVVGTHQLPCLRAMVADLAIHQELEIEVDRGDRAVGVDAHVMKTLLDTAL